MKRVEQKERTRHQLLDAATTEFSRHGYGGARVERIAEAAGVTTGALYAHFRSKEELFLAVYQGGASRMVDAVAVVSGVPHPDEPQRTEAPAPGPGDIAGAADAWLGWHAADPRGIRLNAEFLLGVPDLPPEVRDDVARRRREVRDRLARWLVAVSERRGRRLTVPPDELALLVHALSIGMVLEQAGDPDAVVEGTFGHWVERIFTDYTEPIP